MIGDLVQTARGWELQAPTECVNGHPLTAGKTLVGDINRVSAGGVIWAGRAASVNPRFAGRRQTQHVQYWSAQQGCVNPDPHHR
jgi:hypothetical protein